MEVIFNDRSERQMKTNVILKRKSVVTSNKKQYIIWPFHYVLKLKNKRGNIGGVTYETGSTLRYVWYSKKIDKRKKKYI